MIDPRPKPPRRSRHHLPRRGRRGHRLLLSRRLPRRRGFSSTAACSRAAATPTSKNAGGARFRRRARSTSSSSPTPTSTTRACCRGWPRAASAGRSTPRRRRSTSLRVMLPDSAHIQEKEAEWARERAERDRRAMPDAGTRTARGRAATATRRRRRCTRVADAERCLRQFRPVGLRRRVRAPRRHRAALSRCRAHPRLGDREIWIGTGGARRKLVFSGDIGQPGRPVLRRPDAGARRRRAGRRVDLRRPPAQGPRDDLRRIRQRARADAAARQCRDPRLRRRPHAGSAATCWPISCAWAARRRSTIFVDSPLATRATEITAQLRGDARSREPRPRRVAGAAPRPRARRLHRDRRRIRWRSTRSRAGAVIVAASGMCDGGRIKHHLRHNLPRAGVRDRVHRVPGRAARWGGRSSTARRRCGCFARTCRCARRVHTIGGLSAHGDQAALLGWLGGFRRRRRAPSSSTASAKRPSASRRSSASACTGRRSRSRRAATGCASPDRRAASRAVIRRSRDNSNFALPSRLP